MATLKDAARVTDELVELATRLRVELMEGDVEFERMVELADEVGARADALAATFAEIERAFAPRLRDDSPPSASASG